jgi:hypothetical protein
MMFRQGMARSVAATLAAWALLFHVLVMPVAAAAPAAGGDVLAAFQILCSGADQPGDPAAPGKAPRVQQCVLCGLAGGAADLPKVFRMATPRVVTETLSFALRERQPFPPAPPADARPRDPPAFA